MMGKQIEVRLRVDVCGPQCIPKYFEWVEQECRKAGVPFSDGEPENGVLYRRDDPDDFGCEIWTYVPNAKVRGAP